MLDVGIDVGSTTTKIVAVDTITKHTVFSRYSRHHAEQLESACSLLAQLRQRFPHVGMRAAISGSGGLAIATVLELPYTQEVVANALSIRSCHPRARTAIELGGQDAKMIFFASAEEGLYTVSDMRMNGSCAGGTGAFLDEIASLLRTPIESFNDLASRGSKVYEISGRCGVFAKTDIQPLLNQGASKEDIALSSFHAIAKQTIGGLAQGLSIEPHVAFVGGPFTFNPGLVQVFVERLGLAEGEIIVPESPQTSVALGAALSLDELFADRIATLDPTQAINTLLDHIQSAKSGSQNTQAFFRDAEERRGFLARHEAEPSKAHVPVPGEVTRAWLGIDSGSTTTKFVLVNEDDTILDSFYAHNEGEPIDITAAALNAVHRRYEDARAHLEILGIGTTGYGEMLFARMLDADYHVVETVAHAHAAQAYVPDVSFLLDIGGQDMKAVWINEGVVTDIVVNEACSSGCGSFLESYASSLSIPVSDIAEAAFGSNNPAQLGSRCTVFMNSSIVTEQKNGKTPGDIMAGLCRSIVENVFTKVIRVSNLNTLGNRIVVQGGTFKNDAVLCALEQYVGREAIRSPYPDIMGALGVALLTKEHLAGEQAPLPENAPGAPAATSRDLGELDSFSYTQDVDVACPFCANHCSRCVITFSNGQSWVTGNKCPRGEILDGPRPKAAKDRVRGAASALGGARDMYKVREELLLRDYPCQQLAPDQGCVIGLPRVLSYWETLPFWKTFFRSLGFDVRLSDPSSRKQYESGLSSVTSDTICFPAKLVHGHLRDLAKKGVDRIFMPAITMIESENQEKTSESMCAIVKGYPFVVRNSDDPSKRWGIPFDAPLFHWYCKKDRNRQLVDFMSRTFDIPPARTRKAIRQSDIAQEAFHQELTTQGGILLREVEESGQFAVVLAGRPYHNDSLVNHELSSIFTELDIAVFTADSLPGLREVDLSRSLLDITNNYHARMLAAGIIAARNPHLEYAQVVSFGCGHDACLSDEIVRLMRTISDKSPLMLKVDESDAQGPLRIRIRSFVETLRRKRMRNHVSPVRQLGDPYPVKYEKKDTAEKVVLVPNTSHAFCRLMTTAFRKQGLRTEPLDVGGQEAIRLGKKYTHNDICFPAQIVIGEALEALFSGRYDVDNTAIGMAKYIGCCRLTHYSAMLRKALNDAGFEQVPIITNDDVDSHNLHPGYRMSAISALRIATTLPMIDILEELLRKTRPYELIPGSADQAFDAAMDELIGGLEEHGILGAGRGFEKAIEIMKAVPYDRSELRPSVLIIGEYLLNFHPGANNYIEAYLENNGLEIIEARMTDVIRKSYFFRHRQIKEFRLSKPSKEKLWYAVADAFFELGQDRADRIAAAHPLYSPVKRMPELVKASDPILHHTFDTGEGVLIPAEILHHAALGCKSFVILQPFGCLPNHVVGRGLSKKLKEMHPDIQILALDYDPDVSAVNIENRLQMLISNALNHTSVTSTGQSHEDDDQQSDDDFGGLSLGDQASPRVVLPEAELSLAAMKQYTDTTVLDALRTAATPYAAAATAYVADTKAQIVDTANRMSTDAATKMSDAADRVSEIASRVSVDAAHKMSDAANRVSDVAAQLPQTLNLRSEDPSVAIE